ncbi:MAG: hypothetical protein KF871_14005 [Hydrogenophaga sp.]|uniref:hypothetical protein n=1 Tax=Hydrogenophaga sp. TaxID=1904254 RepID=UPI001D540AB2|nr:hypothetical protein [Hydrogenophaga sp.]MBX3611000.1 hypothetical protein [Hydrogenophaga sp.]
MGKTRLWIGMGLTGVYVLALVVLGAKRWNELANLDLNALGDFFAGAFGPLAILWLVLGYFQQGEELQQNTQALQLQADELKASVKEQQRMAEVAEQQLQEMRELETERHTPRFVHHVANASPYVAQPNYVLRLTNEGASCQNVVANVRMPWGVTRYEVTEVPYMGTWEIPLPWHDQPPSEGPASVVFHLVTLGRGRMTCGVDMSFKQNDEGNLDLHIEGIRPFRQR